MEVLRSRTDPKTKSFSFRFRLADGGEGGLNISKSSMTAEGRFKPASSSIFYSIEPCGFPLKLNNMKELFPLDNNSTDLEDGSGEEHYEYSEEEYDEYSDEEEDEYEDLKSLVEKHDGCNVIWELDLDSLKNPEDKSMYCVFC